MIPLFKVFMSESVDSELSRVLHSGYIGEGPKVQEFELGLSRLLDADYVLTVNSCTSAIQMALRLAGVKPGDSVISTPMTCLATNEPILALGATPLWADVEPYSGMISVESVKELLHSYKDEVSAILCMHWGGYVCNSVGLNNVAAEFGVPVIEDAAQAIGALVGSEYVGNQSRYTCFSFQAIKQLTTGDGGLLVLQSSEEHKRARLMRWFGLDRLASVDMRCGQDPPEYGYKMHMNDIAATIGLANLGTLIERVLVARSNASLYDSLIKSVRTIKPDYGNPSPWVYTVFVENQQRFIAYLTDNGIAASKVHDSNYDKTIFKDSLWCDGLPGVEYFDSHHVCIPVGWWVTDNDAKYIAETVNAYSNVA